VVVVVVVITTTEKIDRSQHGKNLHELATNYQKHGRYFIDFG
jgi:hypothetical protein